MEAGGLGNLTQHPASEPPVEPGAGRDLGLAGSSQPVHGPCQSPHCWCDIFEPLKLVKKIHLGESHMDMTYSQSN